MVLNSNFTLEFNHSAALLCQLVLWFPVGAFAVSRGHSKSYSHTNERYARFGISFLENQEKNIFLKRRQSAEAPTLPNLPNLLQREVSGRVGPPKTTFSSGGGIWTPDFKEITEISTFRGPKLKMDGPKHQNTKIRYLPTRTSRRVVPLPHRPQRDSITRCIESNGRRSRDRVFDFFSRHYHQSWNRPKSGHWTFLMSIYWHFLCENDIQRR